MDGAPRIDGARRLAIRVSGQVQGVGFRPHVHRVARRRGLSGFVLNDAQGVLIEAEGDGLLAFIEDLAAEAPRLARIDALAAKPIPPKGGAGGFEIRRSQAAGPLQAAIPADAGLCDACRAELFDPMDRRSGHPFISCTDCGPRFSITRALPYDRGQTSMAAFEMCDDCAAEYRDPDGRRFHAEPIACPSCGPTLSEPIEAIAETIRRGEIVALKGIGGFHLICDARDPGAVARLRAGKRRDGKPFAVMCLNTASARRLVEVDAAAAVALESHERPVVVLDAKSDAGLAEGVSNGLPSIGVMLPYAPVHHLLFHALSGFPGGVDWLDAPSSIALVATSGNLSGDPLIIDDDAAREDLSGVADLIVGHDRAIVARADDSVMRIVDGAPSFIRRSRGYAPRPIRLATTLPPTLALGGALKTTVTVIRGDQAFVSQHIGDLDGPAARAFLWETAEHFLSITETRPERVACDLHPDFASSGLAASLAERFDARLAPVQHHHAHVAAVLAEHGHTGPAIGLALDGYGMGADGGAWGGEALVVDGADWRRVGHLAEIAQPGGDVAAREPWRMAAAALARLDRADEIAARFADELLADGLVRMMKTGLAPTTSSAGRYFDAAAGLLSVLRRASFEGEAAMRLEGLARRPFAEADLWTIADGVLSLDPLLDRLAETASAVEGANLFHGTVAAAAADWAAQAAAAEGVDVVALSGGCFLNRTLSELLAGRLRAVGLTPLLARRLPPNDGGLSFGQAVVAGLQEI